MNKICAETNSLAPTPQQKKTLLAPAIQYSCVLVQSQIDTRSWVENRSCTWPQVVTSWKEQVDTEIAALKTSISEASQADPAEQLFRFSEEVLFLGWSVCRLVSTGLKSLRLALAMLHGDLFKLACSFVLGTGCRVLV